MKKTIFEYEGLPIIFAGTDLGQMINATEMAKKFNKRPNDFLSLPQTQRFIKTLITRFSGNKDLVLKTVRGRYNAGTWMHEKLALKFAAWLSPEFELWVYDRIHELLKTGKTEIEHQQKGNVFKTLRQMIDQLEEQERINQRVDERLQINSDRIDEIEARLVVQDRNFLSVAAYCSLHHIPCPLDKAQKWGVQATALSRQTNSHFYQIHDPRFGRVGVYHTDILDKVIK